VGIIIVRVIICVYFVDFSYWLLFSI
jgi:hypothetical protein